MSIRFNENLTSTFEYPSESSLCEEIGLSNGDTHFDDDDTDLLYSTGHFLGSSPIGKSIVPRIIPGFVLLHLTFVIISFHFIINYIFLFHRFYFVVVFFPSF